MVFFLILVAGEIGTPLLVVFNQWSYIWAVWVLPQVIIQPMYWVYYSRRWRRLSRLLGDWNR